MIPQVSGILPLKVSIKVLHRWYSAQRRAQACTLQLVLTISHSKSDALVERKDGTGLATVNSSLQRHSLSGCQNHRMAFETVCSPSGCPRGFLLSENLRVRVGLELPDAAKPPGMISRSDWILPKANWAVYWTLPGSAPKPQTSDFRFCAAM